MSAKSTGFDISKFMGKAKTSSRYKRRLHELELKGIDTKSISSAVEGAITNIKQGNARSFVIYGEPQSGKTEMMVALTAHLLDEAFRIIVVLLNDNVQLLEQNLERFCRSGLDPSPKNFTEILDPVVNIGSNQWVLFCKKNRHDLSKLTKKLGKQGSIVIIDDEADYATPNPKINKQEQTKINELISKLLGENGIYIGVTATPARLDLNNTFKNNKEQWVFFKPHPAYHGQDIFFPLSQKELKNPKFNLVRLPDHGDSPQYLRQSLLRFFVNVAYLNKEVNKKEENYSILIHTSGKRVDHTDDYKTVMKTLDVLKDDTSAKYAQYIKEIWDIANKKHPGHADELTLYVRDNINRHAVVVMNSNPSKVDINFSNATSPAALFTIAIGGNIVSRGVTFDNLLSMFFTRDAKHKIQQDTYIQRARMFGSRGKYLNHFELTIPDALYLDWHRCFVFHRLALESVKTGNGIPVWIGDKRISVVASSSIDRATVVVDRGEMFFQMFDLDALTESIVSSGQDSVSKMKALNQHLGTAALPDYLMDFIQGFSPNGTDSLAIHPVRDISAYDDADTENIERRRGFMGKSDLELKKYPNAMHHIKIFYNAKKKARVFYKYTANVKFLKNTK